MLIAEVLTATGFRQCSDCRVIDGTVVPCDWCYKLVCVDHDFVPLNHGYDSGLTLCAGCGDKFEKETENDADDC